VNQAGDTGAADDSMGTALLAMASLAAECYSPPDPMRPSSARLKTEKRPRIAGAMVFQEALDET